MTKITLNEEAELCRAQARHFAGKPEEAILLSLASAFDELNIANAGGRSDGSAKVWRTGGRPLQ